MPKLSAIVDTEELDNLYADKAIVYVEGESDEAVFTVLAGPDIGDRLEFKVPKTGGSGYHAVRDRVLEERGRGNAKIHGLLDGEASASFGHILHLIENRETLFQTTDPALDGLIFLSETELENLILCHAGVAEFLTNNVTLTGIGGQDLEAHRSDLVSLSQRFYLLAMMKFAAGELHRTGTPCKQVDKLAGRFQTTESTLKITREIKASIEKDGGDWNAFVTKLNELMGRVRERFADDGTRPPPKERQVRRLADGKGLLKRVIGKNNGQRNWEGHLVERLRQSPYAADFRQALLHETGA